MLKSTTGATIIVNDTGIYIQNGKGASIMMTGPTVTINAGALVVVINKIAIGSVEVEDMPGFLVHVGATVLCSHGGQAQPTVPNPRVTVLRPADGHDCRAVRGCRLRASTSSGGEWTVRDGAMAGWHRRASPPMDSH